MWRDYMTRTGGAAAPGSGIGIPEAHHLCRLSKQAAIVVSKIPKTTTVTPETLLLARDVEKRTNWIFPAIQIEDEILPCRSLPFRVSQEEDWSRSRNRILGEAWSFHNAVIFDIPIYGYWPRGFANSVHWTGLRKFRSLGGEEVDIQCC